MKSPCGWPPTQPEGQAASSNGTGCFKDLLPAQASSQGRVEGATPHRETLPADTTHDSHRQARPPHPEVW
ncbi:hypothetical protein [Thiothrix winogradskyi]|uniref:Uncharacterized protein n=1 Tax=Thiothrix winogradskyi TaxID=96472 RepID=A0ABY3T551_9GAMM|nr:hypothetical protein [Thiothrix winogradskyi]UJS26425.1 hypothetical protein L2Y54_10390 [Thiothrix winogradskyi]